MKGNTDMPHPVFQTILDAETLNFDENLNRSVSLLLKKKPSTISVSEPLTSGQVSERLTQFPGSSLYFKGSIICYVPLAKIQVGQISPNTVNKHGWLSTEVTLEMARNVRKMYKSDIGLSVSGVAGPGDVKIENDNTGKVFIALTTSTIEKVIPYQFDGTRTIIRQKASQAALVLVKQWLMKQTT
jgi:PncC family amidohydrolase